VATRPLFLPGHSLSVLELDLSQLGQPVVLNAIMEIDHRLGIADGPSPPLDLVIMERRTGFNSLSLRPDNLRQFVISSNAPAGKFLDVDPLEIAHPARNRPRAGADDKWHIDPFAGLTE
jgi:hypothetical protein